MPLLVLHGVADGFAVW